MNQCAIVIDMILNKIINNLILDKKVEKGRKVLQCRLKQYII